MLVGLTKEELAVFDSPFVRFQGGTPSDLLDGVMSITFTTIANMSRSASCEKAFALASDDGKRPIDYVFNLAGLPRLGQSPEVYQEHIVDTAKRSAEVSAKYQVKCFIHVSTAHVYQHSQQALETEANLVPVCFSSMCIVKLRLFSFAVDFSGRSFLASGERTSGHSRVRVNCPL